MSDLAQPAPSAREPFTFAHGDAGNPVGLDGIEFIEYATREPQALGQVLETAGFRPVARHRSREVMLYRQGPLNLVINAHAEDMPGLLGDSRAPVISAIALRVRDARAAFAHVRARGAWDVPGHAEIMELNIPAIHGPGKSLIYLVDRYDDFSIYDVDFVPIPSVDPNPPAIADIGFFGIVQYIGSGRSADWIEFYRELFGFEPVPDSQRYGVMPKGHLMQAPSRTAGHAFMLQLVEPEPGVFDLDERFHRIGLGVPDVGLAVDALRRGGMEFSEPVAVGTELRGAITRTYLGSVVFELVRRSATA
ncbi:MAG: 4-hydroxyphenylpyruvate dioxygenase [Betaproteobacteria bacterium]|nr:4-hydroxyphenylpyruvate dioxygenase [Betaproteobacteria bacterium]